MKRRAPGARAGTGEPAPFPQGGAPPPRRRSRPRARPQPGVRIRQTGDLSSGPLRGSEAAGDLGLPRRRSPSTGHRCGDRHPRGRGRGGRRAPQPGGGHAARSLSGKLGLVPHPRSRGGRRRPRARDSEGSTGDRHSSRDHEQAPPGAQGARCEPAGRGRAAAAGAPRLRAPRLSGRAGSGGRTRAPLPRWSPGRRVRGVAGRVAPGRRA